MRSPRHADTVRPPIVDREPLSRRTAGVALAALLGGGCSLAPLAPPSSASSVGEGEARVAVTALPTVAVSLVRGLTDAFDIGLGIEQADTLEAWARYGVLNDPRTLALAVTGGAFVEGSANEARGVHLGVLVDRNLGSRWSVFGGYRHFGVTYDPAEDEGFFSSDNRVVTDDTDALSRTSQLHAALSYRFERGLRLNLGAICSVHHENDDRNIRTSYCLPQLGVSTFSRR